MFELLSLIFGGLLRLAPEVIKIFGAKEDHAHERAMTTLQLQIDQARATQALDMAHAQAAIAADAADMAALVESVKAQAVPSGVKWIDALSSSVRPVLTYWWCLVLYTSAKVCGLVVAVQSHATLQQIMPLLVGDFDRMVIGSIFSFWFMDRALRKFGRLE